MPLIFITGVSTAGKSSIAKELTNRGYEAYDSEHDGMSAWYSRKTGARVAGFNEIPERTPEWARRHVWNISLERVKQLATKARAKLIFLCGTASNNQAVQAMSSTVVWLQTDGATIKDRITNPRDHDWGREPHELAGAIASNEEMEAVHRTSGSVIVDARQPLAKVVEEILSKVI